MKENINLCKNCNNDDVAVIHTPYAFKLFIQELETMGIQPRLNTEFIDMPIDQAELVRISNAGAGGGGSGSEGDDNGDEDIGDDRDNANVDTSEAIDYALFNSQIDNFATKNTIIDEKVWKDTYDNNFDKIKGGGMYEDYEEDVEDGESEEDDMDDEADEADEDERIQEGGDDDDDDEDSSSSSIYELEESVGGDSGDSDNSDGEEIWNDDTDPNATVEAVAKTDDKADDKAAVEANIKETKGGGNSDIKELFIEM
jgi:hypothetical protein